MTKDVTNLWSEDTDVNIAKTDTPVLNCHRFKACGEAREAWLKEHTDGLTFEDWLFAPVNVDT